MSELLVAAGALAPRGTSRSAQSRSASSLLILPPGKTQLAFLLQPFTSKHCTPSIIRSNERTESCGVPCHAYLVHGLIENDAATYWHADLVLLERGEELEHLRGIGLQQRAMLEEWTAAAHHAVKEHAGTVYRSIERARERAQNSTSSEDILLGELSKTIGREARVSLSMKVLVEPVCLCERAREKGCEVSRYDGRMQSTCECARVYLLDLEE